MSIFKKKEIAKVKSILLDPDSMVNPTTINDYLLRGMANYARENYEAAEADLRQAASLDANEIEAHYRLGIVYKAQKRNAEAVEAFNRVLYLIPRNSLSRAKANILQRLTKGHINELTQGDWNLEKEIWQHIQ